MPITPLTILKRLALWTLICGISAAPSFALALSGKANVYGMLLAIALFVYAYTAFTTTADFKRFYRRPFIRSTMYVGYGVRLTMSLLVGLGLLHVGPDLRLVGLYPDMICGLLSLFVASWITGTPNAIETAAQSFGGALLTTCISGALLNVIVFLVMLIAYGLQRLFRTPPPETGPRGFEVMVASAATLVPSPRVLGEGASGRCSANGPVVRRSPDRFVRCAACPRPPHPPSSKPSSTA